MRRWVGVAATVTIVAIIAVVGVVLVNNFDTTEASETDAELSGPQRTVAVARTDLVSTETLTGTLRYADPATLIGEGSGTITDLPDGGDRIGFGDTAYEMNGRPVILFEGPRPAWRPLQDGVDDGSDVEQLEANLDSLGFGDDDLVVDTQFDDATIAAIERWQADLGLEETGTVDPGDIVYSLRPIRVGETYVDVGSVVVPGTPIYETSGVEREVLVLLAADNQDLISERDEVTIELPDGVTTVGTVRSISKIVITDGAGPDADRVVEVLIDPSGDTGQLDETPVDVIVAESEATDVLAVPVEALLALADGGYALEVPSATGTALVAIELGKFADGLVEVIGDISEGDEVVVP